MALSDRRARDAAMASYMYDHKGSYPDSVRRPHNGAGSGDRVLSRVPNYLR